jgi:hypothetical protein
MVVALAFNEHAFYAAPRDHCLIALMLLAMMVDGGNMIRSGMLNSLSRRLVIRYVHRRS